MAEPYFLCPLCGREMLVRPARWQRCHYCGGQVLVPSALRPVPVHHGRCGICGDMIRLQDADDEDAVCQPCFDANLRGGFPVERPTVAPLLAPLIDALVTRRESLQQMNEARWPLTHEQAQEG